MAIVRFDPVRELSRLQAALADEGAWVPPVDIYEAADKTLVIKAELPELKREAIAVTVEQGALTISGERPWPADVPKSDVRRQRTGRSPRCLVRTSSPRSTRRFR